MPRPPTSTLFPYTTLFRSRSAEHPLRVMPWRGRLVRPSDGRSAPAHARLFLVPHGRIGEVRQAVACLPHRSEEHTSELQSPVHLVCRLLLEKKKKYTTTFS